MSSLHTAEVLWIIHRYLTLRDGLWLMRITCPSWRPVPRLGATWRQHSSFWLNVSLRRVWRWTIRENFLRQAMSALLNASNMTAPPEFFNWAGQFLRECGVFVILCRKYSCVKFVFSSEINFWWNKVRIDWVHVYCKSVIYLWFGINEKNSFFEWISVSSFALFSSPFCELW